MKIAIVVPTRNCEAGLERLLKSIERQSTVPVEIIIVDNFSEDGTREVAQSHGVRCVTAGPERSAQRNLGASLTKADGVLFLDSDMELTPNVTRDCQDELDKVDAICIREEIVYGRNYWAHGRCLERRSYFRSLKFEAARCIRMDVFLAINGYDPLLTGLEDMDLQAKLVEGGFSIGWSNAPILHHEEDLSLYSYLRKRARYSLTDEAYAKRHREFWLVQSSMVERARIMLGGLRDAPLREAIAVLPGLGISRGLEFLMRALFI